MQLFQEIRRRLRHLLAPLFWLVLTFYFGYHAINGERGLRRLFELKQEIQIASQVAEEIACSGDGEYAAEENEARYRGGARAHDAAPVAFSAQEHPSRGSGVGEARAHEESRE